MKRAHTASSAVCLLAIAAFLFGGWEHPTAAQQASDELDLVQIRPNFYVIAGAGGNIVVQIGPEGVILVDSGATEAADRVLATIREEARGSASGATVSARNYIVMTFRDGKILRYQEFYDQGMALEAAGLREEGL